MLEVKLALVGNVAIHAPAAGKRRAAKALLSMRRGGEYLQKPANGIAFIDLYDLGLYTVAIHRTRNKHGPPIGRVPHTAPQIIEVGDLQHDLLLFYKVFHARLAFFLSLWHQI